MAIVIYRDIACANGHEAIYAILSRMVLNGWTTVASSDGTTRGTSAPGSAATLNNSNAWWLLNHTASGRKLGIQRKADSNTWTIQVTPPGKALSTGSASTMDSNASYTKSQLSNTQMYPSTGTTNTKLHLVIDDATANWIALLRRTPHPGTTYDACTILGGSEYTDQGWPANGDPYVTTFYFDDSNRVGAAPFLAGVRNYSWLRFGVSGEAWNGSTALESPGGGCGHTTTSPSGTDLLLELRWTNTSLPGVLGTAPLIRGLQPYREPTVGVDSGGTLNWAAFGPIAVPNDGIALTS